MADVQDWKGLSTVDKIEHKNWKARLEGYDEALKEISKSESGKDPLFNQYLGLVKNMVIDSNAVAQEKALEVILSFVQEANIAGKAASDICPGIVNKCFNSTRQKTRELGFDILKTIIEIEKQDVVMEELVKGLSCKTPKVVVGSILVLKESLHEFGPKIVPIKELFKTIPKLLEDRDKNVREAGKELVIELYLWLGKTAISSVLSQLKPVQVNELTAEFEKLPTEKPMPTRYLRSQKPKETTVIKATGGGDSAVQSNVKGSTDTAIDPYDFLDPVEVISKIPNDFYEKIEEKKWTDRKDALEIIDKLTNHEKLVPGEYGELVKVLLRVVAKDSNIVLVALASKILYQIAKGLRKKYFPYSLNTVQVCLEKFKEKKANVVKALRDCIDFAFAATTFDACMEDIVGALDHKTPSVRSETSLFLNRIFEKSSAETLTVKLLKQLMPGLTKLCLDSTPEVRDASFQTIGTAMKVVGEKKLKPFLDKMDNAKMTRINEFYEKAKTESSQPVNVTSNPPVNTAVSKPVSKPETDVKKPEKSAATPKQSASAKKPVAKPQKPTTLKVPEIPTEPLLSDEEVTLKATQIFGELFLNQITDKNWKERSTALETLQNYVKSQAASELPCQLMIKLILLKPGLKDNNVLVIKSKIELIKEIIMSGKLTWTTAEMIIGDLAEKIGDIKNCENVKSALTEMSDAISLSLVANQVIKTASENVNIKNLTETLNWLSDVIKEFGFKITLNDVLPFIRLAIQHTSPIIRQSGIKLIGTISLYVRDVISTLLKDEKSSIKQLIDQEIEAQKSNNPPPPTRGLKNISQAQSGETETEIPICSNPVEVDIEELIPRENISNRITENLMTNLADKAIKIKREALEEVTKIVSDCPGISGEGLQGLLVVIAKNTSDSSSVISKMAINILVAICNGLSKKDAEKFVKIVIPALLSSCNDPKPKSREDSVTALNVWTDKVGFPVVIEGSTITDALKGEKPFQKDAIFSWIAPYLKKLSDNKAAKKLLYPEFASEFLPHLYAAIEDRNKEVRESSREVILPFMLVFGYDLMVKYRKNNSKGVTKDTILPLLEKVKSELPVPEPVAVSKSVKAPVPNSKPSSPKESSSKKSEQAAGKSKKDEAKVASDAGEKETAVTLLLAKSSNKKQRILEDKKKKITRWEPNSTNAQQLNTQFTNNCSAELLGLLFSNDLKKFIKAIDLLNNFLSEDNKDSIEATKQNLDMILKWMVLRFNETNPSVIIKGLDYLCKVFSILCLDTSFQLSEQETVIFIPDLILKMGDPKDQVRTSSQKILRFISSCGDNLKIAQILEENLSCKVARVRQESVDFLKSMIDERKIDVLNQKLLLKSIALLISERDNTVRTAALNCLVSAHNMMGEDLFNLLDSLPEKDRSMLLERIKRTGKPVPSETSSSSKSINAISEKSLKPSSGQRESLASNKETPMSQAQGIQPVMTKSQNVDINPLLKEDISYKLINVDREIEELQQPLEKITLRYSGRASQSVNSNDAITSVIHAINSNDVQTSIQAMAQIDEVIRNQDVRSQLINYMDNLVMSITMQLKSTLGKLSEEKFSESEITDMFKGMLATLVSVFNAKDLAGELNRDRLMNLMQSILRIVINDQLVSLSEGGTIIRGINILSVRILESSNQTRMLSALLRMMSDCLKNGDTNSKYLNLIFKCVWSMTKNLINTINSIDLVVILKDIHAFYTDFPPYVWEAREGGRDVPLRTVKTLVYSIISNKNGGVLEALYKIPNTPHKDLDMYIRKSYAKLNVPIPTVLPCPSDNVNVNESQTVLSDKSKFSVQSNTRPYLNELKEIFGKIGNPTKNKQGLNDLYDFKLNYPNVDLSRYLSQTTPYFQRTIENGLKTIAEERGQTQISVFRTNQENNNGASSGFEKDSMVYCNMDPEALLLRLKNLRVKAGLDKCQAEKPTKISISSPVKDEMETSLISKLVPSGDGPTEPPRPVNKRKMSATDLAAIKQRFEALKRPN